MQPGSIAERLTDENNPTVSHTKIQNNRYGRHPVPPGLPAAVFEARMRENAREGQMLKSNHFVGRGTQCRPFARRAK